MTTSWRFELLIFSQLSVRAPDRYMLAARFAMSAPAISRHLSVLENAGLVQSRREGQRVLYALVPDNLVNTLTGFAFEVCPVGRPLKRESRALARRKPRTS